MKVYNYKEIKDIYKNEYNINIQIKRKKIYKIMKGIYSNVPNPDDLVILFKKYPGCILSLESAFYYYELSQHKPDKIVVGTRRNFTRITMPNVKQLFYSNTFLDDNAIHYKENGLEVNIFSRERLLVELIKNQKKFSSDYYNEVYNNYLRISDSLDEKLVLKYAEFYNSKSAKLFAKSYIHNIKKELYDDEYLLTTDKNKAYAYGKINCFNFDKKCECCHEISIDLWQEVCYKCGWWNSYMKTEDQYEFNEKNQMSLFDYREHYLDTIKNDDKYTWSERRNRTRPIRKIIKNEIIDHTKSVCACCERKSINRWYDQCPYCGWIADYYQETESADYGDNGPNEYPLYWYKEDYYLFIKEHPHYIYKRNPNKFKKFLDRDS